MAFGGLRGTLTGFGTSIVTPETADGSVAVSLQDLVVVMVAEAAANTVTTVTDNLGQTYTAINAGTLSSVGLRGYYRYVTVAGTLTQVSCVMTSSSNDHAISVAVYEGPFTSTPLDRAPANTTDAATPYTCAATTVLSQANELIVAGLGLIRCQTATATAPNILAINTLSAAANTNNAVSATIGQQLVAATTSVTPVFASSGTITGGVQIVASFRQGVLDTARAAASATGTAASTGRGDISGGGAASAAGAAAATGLATLPIPLGLVARSSVSSGSANSRTTPAIDTTGANLVFVHISHAAGVSVTLSDNYFNTWLTDLVQGNRSTSPDVISRIYRVAGQLPNVGPGHTFTFDGANSFATIQLSAWRSGTPHSNSGLAVGTGALPHGTSGITTASAGDLVFALAAGNGTLTRVSQGTILDKVEPVLNYATGYAYFIQPSSPNINVSWSGAGDTAVTNYAFHGTWVDANASDGSAPAVSSASAFSPVIDTAIGTATAFATAYAYAPQDTGAGTATAQGSASAVGLGTGGGPPNTIISSVGSAGGRNYSSLASWAASLPANLVTNGNSYVAELYNDSEFNGGSSTALTLSGHTTSSTRTITVRAATGHSFRDNANVQTNALNYNQGNGVAITSANTGSLGTIDCNDSNVTFSGLQIKKTGNYGSALSTGGGSGASGIVVDNCILLSTGYGTYVTSLLGATNGVTLRNSVFIAAYSGGLSRLVSGLAPNLYFCTFANASDAAATSTALVGGYGTAVAQNCAFFGCTAVNGGSTTYTFTSCMTDVASPPAGITGSKTYANQFQNSTMAAGDYRLKSGADLIGAGTADSTNGATDIAGTTRPQGGSWDIGAWEFKVAVVADTGAGTAAGFSIAYGDGSSGKNSAGNAVAAGNAAATGRADATGLGAAAGLAAASATGRADFASLAASAVIAAVSAAATSDMQSAGLAAALGSAAGASAAGVDTYGAGASAGAGVAGAAARSDVRPAGSATATGAATGAGLATGLDSYGVAAAAAAGLATAAWRTDVRSAGLSAAAGVATGSSSLTGLDSYGAGVASGAGLGQAAGRSDALSSAASAATGVATGASSLTGLDSYAVGAAASVGLAGAASSSDVRSIAAGTAVSTAAGASSSELNVFGVGAASSAGLGQGAGRSDIRSAASAAATAAALGASSSELHVSGAGAAAGIGVAASAGYADFRATGAAASAGTASATGDAGRAGAAAAAATGTAVGIADIGYTTGTAAATGTAAGAGWLDVRVAANAAATGTATSNGRADFRAAGNAAAAGFARAVMLVVGQATSTSTAVAAGRSDVRGSGVAAGLGFADAFAKSDTRSVAISVSLGVAVSFSVEPGETTKTLELRGHMPAPISLTGHIPAAVVLAGSPATAGLVGHASATIALTGQRIDRVDLTGDMGV